MFFCSAKNMRCRQSLTIMEAMEYAGYQLVRGCGCRNGFCGACATIYRIAGRPGAEGMPCLLRRQVEDNMYVATLPFFPLVKAGLRHRKNQADAADHDAALPGDLLPVSAATPARRPARRSLNVMQYIAYAQRGEYEKVRRRIV